MVSDGLRKNRGKSAMGCRGELCSSQESFGEALCWIHAKQNGTSGTRRNLQCFYV